LVVWKLDRLARSTRQLIDTADALKARGIGLKSLTEAIDTTTPGGEFIFTVFAALAQFERSLIVERTREGLKVAIAAGRRPGRKPKLTPDIQRELEAKLRDCLGYPTVSDVIRSSGLGRTTFYKHFPPDRLEELRP
jgi:DNA invertase Pin-like site-specific DNA recombinase